MDDKSRESARNNCSKIFFSGNASLKLKAKCLTTGEVVKDLGTMIAPKLKSVKQINTRNAK